MRPVRLRKQCVFEMIISLQIVGPINDLLKGYIGELGDPGQPGLAGRQGE